MPLKHIAKLEILPEHVKTLVPAEPLQLGWMDAAIHAGREGAAFETVPAKVPRYEPCSSRKRLNDPSDRARSERLAANRGQEREAVGGDLWRLLDAPEHGTLCD